MTTVPRAALQSGSGEEDAVGQVIAGATTGAFYEARTAGRSTTSSSFTGQAASATRIRVLRWGVLSPQPPPAGHATSAPYTGSAPASTLNEAIFYVVGGTATGTPNHLVRSRRTKDRQPAPVRARELWNFKTLLSSGPKCV